MHGSKARLRVPDLLLIGEASTLQDTLRNSASQRGLGFGVQGVGLEVGNLLRNVGTSHSIRSKFQGKKDATYPPATFPGPRGFNHLACLLWKWYC